MTTGWVGCLTLVTPLALVACGDNGASPNGDGGSPDAAGDALADAPRPDGGADAGTDATSQSDASFTVVNLGPPVATFLATAVQPDGRIVAAGASDDAFVVARFTAAGALDTTFGGTGFVQTPFGAVTQRFWLDNEMSVLVQPDGKIVVVSSYSHLGAINASAGIVLRYAADGTLDSTFGGSGYVVDPALWYAGALQPDGNIVSVGRSGTSGGIARYTPAGVLDTTFGGAGHATVGGGHIPYGVALQPDGKIVTVDAQGIARFTTAGSPDATFGTSGRAASSGGFEGVGIQSDGSLVVAGSVASPSRWAVGRYDSAGALDSTFGTGGFATDDGGYSLEGALGLVIQSDGKIVSCGFGQWGSTKATMARHTSAGALDTSYGTSGIEPFGNPLSPTYALALQSDDKVVAAGFGIGSAGFGPRVVRYDTAGAADTTFGASGIALVSGGGSYDRPSAIALAPDGSVVVAGQTGYSVFVFPSAQAGVVRLDPSGQPDAAFGTNGVVTLSGLQYASGVAVQPSGDVLVTGRSTALQFQVMRLDTTGKLDSTFGTSGVAGGYVSGTDQAIVSAMTVAPDGKIVLAGTDFASSSNLGAVMRLASDGTRDATFGTNGAVTTGLGGTDAAADAVAVQPDGKIVIAGAVTASNKRELAVERFVDSGADDTTFGSNGLAQVDLGAEVIPTAIAVQSDGAILVLSASRLSAITTAQAYLVRFTAAGALDTTFGNAGVVVDPTLTTGDGATPAMGLAIQGDGRILVGASTLASTDALLEDATVLRYTTAGALDTSFANAGRWSMPQTPSGVHALLLLPDGSLEIAARVWTAAGNSDFGVARIIP